MKVKYFAIVTIAIAPIAWGQEYQQKTPPAPQRISADNENANKSAQDRSQAIKPADEAVRRVAQDRQGTAASPDGKGGYVGIMPGRTVKAAWLGLTASAPPAALRHQLKLPDGTALVIDFVQPKSPADMAGIKQYDLLIKLNDQILINPEQLAVLVRTFKPGDTIHLNYYREGEKHTQDVKLVERELPSLDDMQYQFQPGEWNFKPLPLNPPGKVSPFGETRSTNEPPAKEGNPGYIERSEHSLTWFDGRRQLTVNLGDDRKTITMTDNRTGRVMYKGPIDGVADQKSLPREARDAVERVRAFLNSNPNRGDNNDGKMPEGF